MAKYPDGTRAEKDVALTIKVDDANDNSPIITAQQVGEVTENCKAGEWDLQNIYDL